MTLGLKWFHLETLQSYIQEYELEHVINFYYEKLMDKKGKILELGKNQLQLLPTFMDRGLKMEGVIESDKGKEACHERCSKLNQSAKLLQAKLPNFKTGSLYDAVIVPFGVMSLTSKRVDSIKLLKNVHTHLKNTGTIIVDLSLQNEFTILQTEDVVIEKKNELIVGESKLVQIDLIEQKATYTLSVEHWNEGQISNKESKVQSYVWFGIKEFKLVLEKIGFSSVIIYADYSDNHKDLSRGKVFTFLAQK